MNFKFFSLAALIVISLFSCAPKVTEISGTLINFKGDKINLEYNNKVTEVSVGTDGTFSSMVKLSQDSYVTLKCGRHIVKMYAFAGRDLTVNYNLEDRERIFNGDSKHLCEYLESKKSIAEKRDWYSLGEDEFLEEVRFFNEERKEILLDQNFNEEFNIKELACMEYETYTFVLNYVPYHGYSVEGEYVPSNKITDFCNNADFNKSELLKLSEYREFINLRATERGYTKNKSDQKLNMTLESANFIRDLNTLPEIKSYMIFNLVKPYVERRGTGAEIYSQLYTIFIDLCKDPEKVEEVAKFAAKWDKIAKGQPSPSFALKDINGETVSLTDLKGKYIYIDVWATWCGPCLGEIPHLMKLEEEMHGKDVTFVSLSTDRNKEQWENFVKKKEMGGVQLINDPSCTFCKDYMIFGIPRFILLDKEGRIVDNNAPRPSGKIKDVLLGLLN